eukprot:10234926-Heterocapsa_arctica.AAC.1
MEGDAREGIGAVREEGLHADEGVPFLMSMGRQWRRIMVVRRVCAAEAARVPVSARISIVGPPSPRRSGRGGCSSGGPPPPRRESRGASGFVRSARGVKNPGCGLPPSVPRQRGGSGAG